MKKAFTLLVLLFLFSSLVVGQIEEFIPEDKIEEFIPEDKIDPTSILSTLSSRTDPLLEKTIEIPRGFKTATEIIFGIRDNTELHFIIIVLAIWAVCSVIIAKALQIRESFEGITGWFGGIGITIAIALSGIFNNVASLLLFVAKIFKPFEEWTAFSLFAVIIILAVILIFSIKLIKIARKEKDKGKDDEMRRDIKRLALQSRAKLILKK